MRTTISLPDELAELARVEARRRGISLSAVIRESLQDGLRRPLSLPWQGIVDDPESPARSLDRVLARSWADDIAGDR
ncbi:MAG: ribbon-helix-helix protein, CopG family [Pseudomonadales bacterium]|nr:ribbon-helix-helix protein, CopG family [Pseudomonadales bacterium]